MRPIGFLISSEVARNQWDQLANINFNRNFSKLLLLAFFCGFSERFVKDAVDSVARRIAKQTNKNDELDPK